MDILNGLFAFLFPIYNKEYILSKFKTNNITEILEKLNLNLIIISDSNNLLYVKNTTRLKKIVNTSSYEKELQKFDNKLNQSNRKHESKSRLRKFLKTGIRGDVVNKNKNINNIGLNTINNQRNNYKNIDWKKLSAWHKRNIFIKYLKDEEKEEDGDPKYIKEIKEAIELNSISKIKKLKEPMYDKKIGEILSLKFKPKKKTNKKIINKRKKKGLLEECQKQRQKNNELIQRSVEFTGSFVMINR